MPIFDSNSLRPGRLSRSSASTLLLIAACALGPLAGCTSDSGSNEHKAPEETVDVAPSLEIPIEDDIQAVPRKVDLAGIMPSSFPKNLPLYSGSSLVDFGDEADFSWVELLADARQESIKTDLADKLRNKGWDLEEFENAFVLRRDGREARVYFRDGDPGTLYRYEY